MKVPTYAVIYKLSLIFTHTHTHTYDHQGVVHNRARRPKPDSPDRLFTRRLCPLTPSRYLDYPER